MILRRCCDRLTMMWLKVWPVSKQVNSPRNNGAELLETISPATPPCVDRLGPREP